MPFLLTSLAFNKTKTIFYFLHLHYRLTFYRVITVAHDTFYCSCSTSKCIIQFYNALRNNSITYIACHHRIYNSSSIYIIKHKSRNQLKLAQTPDSYRISEYFETPWPTDCEYEYHWHFVKLLRSKFGICVTKCAIQRVFYSDKNSNGKLP